MRLHLLFKAMLGFLIAIFAWGPALAGSPTEFQYLVSGSWVIVNPAAWGGEVSFAGVTRVFPARQWVVGPRLSILAAQGSERGRVELNLGAQSMQWLANAVGIGIAADGVRSLSESDWHFRVEPLFSIRLKHFGSNGAWALATNPFYDTKYQWGFRMGLTLQFNGISKLGEGIE